MYEVFEKTKKVLTDYNNMHFHQNVVSLLQETNKKRNELNIKTLKNIIVSLNAYQTSLSIEDLYICKDNVIILYNELLEKFLENEENNTIEENLKDMDKLIYKPIYTEIKMNDCDSGRFPEL